MRDQTSVFIRSVPQAYLVYVFQNYSGRLSGRLEMRNYLSTRTQLGLPVLGRQ